MALVASTVMLMPFAGAQAGGGHSHGGDGDSWFSAEVLIANKYLHEGFLENDGFVNGFAIEFDIPVFPMFIGYSTTRDYDQFHDDEIYLGFDYSVADNTFALGALYEFGSHPAHEDEGDEHGDEEHGDMETEFEEATELFLSFTSAEFYYIRLAAYYSFSFETEGGLLGLGLDVSYDINERLSIGGGLLAEIDRGYSGIAGLSGFYHMDYYLNFGVTLFGESGLNLSATYSAPYRDAELFGVAEEVIYKLSFVFAI